MTFKIGRGAMALLASAFLGAAGAAADTTAVRVQLHGTGTLPAAGTEVPTKFSRITAQAFPVENAGNDSSPISGKASASPKASALSSMRSGSTVTPMAYGNSSDRWPYTASRVASSSASVGTSALENPVTASPYRQTGLMLVEFMEGGSPATYQCSASLIMPNVLVTAAHCVQDFGLGAAGSAINLQWVPANTGDPTDPAQAPFGIWQGKTFVVSSSYYYGSDTCAKTARGIVCNNDIALVSLYPQGSNKAATVLGDAYYYGWNGYSYIKSPAFKNMVVADITELGYPVAFDDGEQMQRNNSLGKYIATKGAKTTTRKTLLNTQIGTPLTGGSSGGPWLVNFGTTPDIDTSQANLGNASLQNVVVGVTSYGYVTPGLNVQGASFFGQNYEWPGADYGGYGGGNIGGLMQSMCTTYDPAACLP